MNYGDTSAYRQLDASPVLAAVHRLQTDRSYRDQRGLFFAEGVRNFVAAVDHKHPLKTVIYSEKLLIHPIARKLVRMLKRASVPFVRLSPEQFRSISRTERASGVAAILHQRVQNLNDVKPGGQHLWTALSEVRSPGNFGTLVRTSAATGSNGFVLLGDSVDPFDPMVVRAAMGALFKQRLIRASAAEIRDWTARHNVQVVGASPDGSVEYDRFQYSRPVLLLLGTERNGLSRQQREACHDIVRIPMVEGIDSLNLAVAGSLLMYQVFRSSPG